PLCRVRPLVDEELTGAPAFMHRPRPPIGAHEAQAIEIDVPMPAAVDLDGDDRLALVLGGPAVELARTSIGAIAVRVFAPFDFPDDLPHRRLPLFIVTTFLPLRAHGQRTGSISVGASRSVAHLSQLLPVPAKVLSQSRTALGASGAMAQTILIVDDDP